MNTMDTGDLRHIAARLSTAGYGRFGLSNLVSLGDVLVVKPGGTTENGVVLSGHDVANILAGEFIVFPLALEYSPLPGSETLASVAGEIEDLDGDLRRVPSPRFGAANSRVSARLRRRYERVARRYRKVVSKSISAGRPGMKRRAERLLRRLGKIWKKMESKGVTLEGLTSPPQIKASVVRTVQQLDDQAASSGPRSKRPRSLVASGYDLKEDDDGLPLTDDDLLEDDDDLSADLRSETVGYLFSDAEHDYFGLSGTSAEIVLADDSDLLDASDADELEQDAVRADREMEALDEDLDEDLDDDLDLDDELDEVESGRAFRDEVAPMSKRQAVKAAKSRADLSKELAQARHAVSEGDPSAALKPQAKALREMADLLDYLDARLKKGSPNQGVQYHRLRPATRPPGRPPPRVVAIGIRKRPGRPLHPLSPVPFFADPAPIPDQGVLEYYGAAMANVPQGYSPVESLHSIQQHTAPMDYIGIADHHSGAGVWRDDDIPS